MEGIFSTENLGFADSFNYTNHKLGRSLNTKLDEIVKSNGQFGFESVPLSDPTQLVHNIKDAKGPERSLMEFKKGTTTLAFKFQGGVIVAVDSRASQGSFDASETVRKIIEINDQLLGTMAGGAADCQFWEQYLAIECRKYQLQNREKVSVAAASRILINILYSYRNHGLSMGCMLTGWDHEGAQLYYLDNDGQRIKGNIFSCGSGSTYAYGVLDNEYHYNISLKEAVELGRKAIYHATHRDAGSGGVVRIYHVHAPNAQGKGWTIIEDGEDVNKLHYQYEGAKGVNGDGDFVNAELL
ncbi:hypothetical protein ABPG74_020937 [Tetrahymena malaccensis]